MKLNKLSLLGILGLSSFAAQGYELTQIGSGLSIPWSIEFVDKNTALISERNGSIVELNLDSGSKQALFKPDNVEASGQGGLMDLAIHPKHPQTIYLTYSKETSSGPKTTLASFHYQGGEVTDFKELYVSNTRSSSGRHFGSRIAIDENDHIYFSIGDRGTRDNGQDLQLDSGSILRLNGDGNSPKDNPFAKTKDGLDSIWSYGHRNPQGITFDKQTGQLWAIEHGPRGGDEINLIQKGANYGWPITSHGKEYWGPLKVGDAEHMEGIESPKLVYVPSIAPSGMVLYRGKNYPKLNGKLLAGA
ncbi:PQQ-dependent oxidoreductase, gdhB family [Vibrio ishigakensis]|nr:PQQ-dependent oxidoreductase, gdhB family [Vibrio ishigakensis]